MLSSPDYQQRLTESALAWWREAGVDYVTDGAPMNWLNPDIARSAAVKPVERAVIEHAAPIVSANAPLVRWPDELATLKAAIASGHALPGCNYGPNCIAPLGEAGATALVIGDFPEEAELSAGQFGAGPVGVLQTSMLLACAIVPDLTYQTALALSRPAAGSLPKGDLDQLASFARHQIAMIKPKVIVLFGSAACEALLAQELMQARGNLLHINHDDGKTAAIATFHPRTLMAQPQLKAQAWKDLQMLARKDYL
jgi:uracil-DNA glycosylase